MEIYWEALAALGYYWMLDGPTAGSLGRLDSYCFYPTNLAWDAPRAAADTAHCPLSANYNYR